MSLFISQSEAPRRTVEHKQGFIHSQDMALDKVKYLYDMTYSRSEILLSFVIGYNQKNTGQASCDPCPAGYYCQSKTSNPIKCPPRHYCPAATITPITCPNGTYTNDSMTGLASADQCLPCITGSYCRLGQVVGPCHGGYYCKSRSPDPNPTGVWNAVDASIAISPCPDNMTGNHSDGYCSNCRTGKFCVHGKYVVVKIEMSIGERTELLRQCCCFRKT